MSDDGSYEVGYGKPPKHTQWPKGKSGNPGGRPKGSRGLRGDLDRELETRLKITIMGQEFAGTSQQLMLRMLSRRAAHGDVRASRILLDLVLQIFGAGDRGGKREELSAEDEAIFENLMAAISELPARDAERPEPPDDAKPGPDEPGAVK